MKPEEAEKFRQWQGLEVRKPAVVDADLAAIARTERLGRCSRALP